MSFKRLAPAIVSSLIIGCAHGQPKQELSSDSHSAPSLPSDVLNVTWEWVSLTTPVEQITVDEPGRYTMRFEGSRVAIRADCNRGGSTYSVTADRRIAFNPIALTRMMCPEGSLSDRFARDVGRATVYFQREGDLFLDLPVDSGTLRFRRQP